MGEEAALQIAVTEEMLVRLAGRGTHPVYATAWLARHMEEAGRMLIEPHLDSGEQAAGRAISVVHERAAHVGDRLTVVARVLRADANECEAEVEAVGPDGRVGSGTVVLRYAGGGRRSE